MVCVTAALVTLPVHVSPHAAKEGEILNSKPHAPLPPFESLDNFGRSYFSRAVYDEVRTQNNSHLGLAGRSVSNQWARQCTVQGFELPRRMIF